MKLFEEYKLYEEMWNERAVSKDQQPIAEEIDDPYGYGPYKTFSDPDLKVGDYVLAPRPFDRGGKTYPAKITGISAKWIDYEISGFGFTDKGTKVRPGSQAAGTITKAKNYLGNLQEAATSWEAEVVHADNFLDAIIKATGNENYDDGDGYWETEGTTWCNRYLYYSNNLNNTSLVKDLCDLGSSKIPNANFYYIEDDMEEEPVSEIGYTLTKASVADSGCKGADCKKDLKEEAGYRVVLADYDTDDFDINVEFGMQDPEENEVVDYEYLLKPGQTAGDLVVWLSRDCGYTSIYVHDERPATDADIKRLASQTFPVTGTGDEWRDYGDIN